MASSGVCRFKAKMQVMNKFLISSTLLWLVCAQQWLNAATLVGRAEMPMHMYAEGPTTGQFERKLEVIKDKQLVQGFSAVLKAKEGFYFLTDNGFGYQKNSADVLLRLYEVKINLADKDNADNSVQVLSFLNIRDPDKKIGFEIQADFSHYYNEASNPSVDANIQKNRLLTGADLDPESIRLDKNGFFWLGDEFGPFLVKLDASGKVLRSAVPIEHVQAPENPYLRGAKPNLPSSGGFEAMAINPSGDKLYPLLEGAVKGDDRKTLRLYVFDINSEQYEDAFFLYQLAPEATNVSDMVAINDSEFLVLERNTATSIKKNAFKKIYLIDISDIKKGGFVKKRELVDLMNLDDPDDLNGDGNKTYAYAYSHVESLLVLDKNTLLVGNDNNYIGRSCFIKLKLDDPLHLANFATPNLNTADWQQARQAQGTIDLGDHTFYGWMTVLAYLLASLRSGYMAKVALKANQQAFFWIGLTVFLALLGFNKHLDLQSDFTEVLRGMAKEHGWYLQRRGLQLMFIVAMGIAIPILLISVRVMLTNSWRRYKIIWTGIVLLLVFIVIRAASFHHVDLFFYHAVGGIKYYQAIELLAICIIILGTFFENRMINVGHGFSTVAKDVVEIDAEGEIVSCPNCFKKPIAEIKDGRMFKCKSCGYKYTVRVVRAD